MYGYGMASEGDPEGGVVVLLRERENHSPSLSWVSHTFPDKFRKLSGGGVGAGDDLVTW